MELLQLKYFQAVAQCEHLTNAARQLGIAQPALSSTIIKLEHELGVQLFDRVGRNIRLNEYGKTYLYHVNLALSNLELGKNKLDIMRGALENIVNIAVTSPIFSFHILKEIILKYPQIRIYQNMTRIGEVRKTLEQKEVDFAICSPPVYGEELECTIIGRENVVLAVNTRHPFASRKSIRLIEACNEDFIEQPKGYGFREYSDALCRQAGFDPRVVMECDHTMRSKMVALGIGITITTQTAVEREFKHPEICVLRIEDPPCHREIALVKNKNQTRTRTAKKIEEEIIRVCEDRVGHVPSDQG